MTQEKHFPQNFLTSEISGVVLWLIYLGFDTDVILDMFYVSKEDLTTLLRFTNEQFGFFI